MRGVRHSMEAKLAMRTGTRSMLGAAAGGSESVVAHGAFARIGSGGFARMTLRLSSRTCVVSAGPGGAISNFPSLRQTCPAVSFSNTNSIVPTRSRHRIRDTAVAESKQPCPSCECCVCCVCCVCCGSKCGLHVGQHVCTGVRIAAATRQHGF